MMIDINDIKNGMTVIIDGTLYQIVEFLHVKPGKGAAFMKIKLKNLKANTTLEKTFNTNIKIQKANITKMPMQYLYTTGDTYNFMNMETYEQVELPKEQIKDEIKYLKENLEVELVYFEEFVICVPPLASVYQPINLYPVLVGVGKVPYSESNVTFLLEGDTFPPFALNVTIYVLGVQCAYNLVPPIILNVESLVICVPPSVYQPVNV